MITQETTVEAGITKVCNMCKLEKKLIEFSLDKKGRLGRRSYCKQCDVERLRKWHIENKEKKNAYARQYIKNNREKYHKNIIQWKTDDSNRPKAHAAVNRAIRRGSIVRPLTCSKCNQPGPVEAHHDSYAPDRWLDVVFLCRSCHKRLHAENPNLTR